MAFLLERSGIDLLFQRLRQLGYEVVGPTVREGAIVYDSIQAASDLPVGWTEEQEAGVYRLKRRGDEALFGYAVGPHSWKKFLHPPQRLLWSADRQGANFEIRPEPLSPMRYAFVGVRACELKAIGIQDRVFLEGGYQDPSYRGLREAAFLLGVNCGQAGGTCFCASMDAGPELKSGFDLALTEVLAEGRHYFVVEQGSERGAEVLGAVPRREAASEEVESARRVVAATSRQMGRRMDTTDIQGLFYKNYDHSRWDEVAARCLACANCTMVCPTCFCTTVEDITDLKGEHAERWQKWDSCFTLDFSYTHGTGSHRASIRSRYRQWLTHKLATWIDQFGASGCVGCGRCVTWCPVGIDLTEEVAALRKPSS